MYKSILDDNGNNIFVDYGMTIDAVIVPSNLKLLKDGLTVSAEFDFSSENANIVKDRAWRWYKQIRQRVKHAIYDGMRYREEILSGSSTSMSESSGSGSAISAFYDDSSSASSNTSVSSDSTDELDNISPSNLVFNYKASAGVLVATLTHDLAYTDRKLLNTYPTHTKLVYGPSSEFGFKIPAQYHTMKDGLVVEIHLRYNSKNYNNCVNAASAWFSKCSMQLRQFLNTLRS